MTDNNMYLRLTHIQHKLKWRVVLAFLSLQKCQNDGSLRVVSHWSSYIIIRVRDAPAWIAKDGSHLNWQVLKEDQKYTTPAHLPGNLNRESEIQLTAVKKGLIEVNLSVQYDPLSFRRETKTSAETFFLICFTVFWFAWLRTSNILSFFSLIHSVWTMLFIKKLWLTGEVPSVLGRLDLGTDSDELL